MLYTLQPVNHAQHKLLRMITGLPLQILQQDITAYLILSSDNLSQLLGAVLYQQQDNKLKCWLTILPQYRRLGLAKAVYHQLATEKLNSLANFTITPWDMIEEIPAREFLRSLDFSVKEEFDVFEADFAIVKQHAEKHFKRLIKRGSIPMADISCAYGEEVDTAQAQQLLSADFSASLNIRLGQIILTELLPHQVLFSLSYKNNMVGVGVGRFVETAFWTDAYVIAPAFRHGWAHLAIKHLSYERISQERPDIKTFQFITTEKLKDTNSYARRLNAQHLGKNSYFEKNVNGG